MIPFLIMIVLLALVLTYAASKPNTFRIERSLLIHASPEKLFPLINDFQRWETWSPCDTTGAAMKRSFSGATHGKHAICQWQGIGRTGAGRMEIIVSQPYRRVIIQIDLVKPRPALHFTEFTFDLVGHDTTVTWAVFGSTPYPHKLLGLFINMDRLLGAEFEKGLLNLKHSIENKEAHSVSQHSLGA